MKKIFCFAYSIAALALLMSCSSNENENATSLKNSQEVSVFLTDAPNPNQRPDPFHQNPWRRYISVNLDIVGIQYFAKDSLGKDSVWVTPDFQETTVKVSSLANGDSILLTKINIPVGQIVHKIKFLLGKNSSVLLSDSTEKQLIISSRSDSSLVIHVGENPPKCKYSIMLDFDIVHSIIMGPNGNFYLVPVMRGFIMEQCANIIGNILPKDLATKVFVVNGSDTIATVSDVLHNNRFKLSGFHSGTYLVQFMPLDSTSVTKSRNVTLKGCETLFLSGIKVN